MSRLLLDDKPLIILPSLAEVIGLNESIILQQLHYWLKESQNFKEGSRWVYNTYGDWQKQFPFWSVSTIRRTITKLESLGLIIVGNFNKLKIDNTKWYRINYSKLQGMNRPSVQNEQMDCSKWTDGEVNMNRPLPEITTETTTEIKNISIPFSNIIDYLNLKANTNYKSSTKKTKDLIKARWNEDFKLEDFKRVIDKKVSEWINDPNMNKYLRPETLFGTKFEAYLNQKGGVQNGKGQTTNSDEWDFDF
ncbi:conserved phage C-terminal domain-containing protein [Bacillus sp. 1P06AnD]|uniref:conserved phage C-terminal domain-containing protein n=1 Tax=Bacillus sp. 1P06AnD TaxID=3132208 RepID=UPI0039A06BC7